MPEGGNCSVRLIDCVGYMVPGAIGQFEDDQPRMVTTPWYEHEIPMTEAAEIGTKKVMEEHCSIGIVITTDGSITDIPRTDYIAAEERAIRDMQATGKPFVVLVNSSEPKGSEARILRDYIADAYGVSTLCVDCLRMGEEDLKGILRELLYAFPMQQIQVFLPAWLRALDYNDPLKLAVYRSLRKNAGEINRLAEAEAVLEGLKEPEEVKGCRIVGVDLADGSVSCELTFREGLFYELLREKTGFRIENDGQLLSVLTNLAKMKKEFDKISAALEEVKATGYGIVMPGAEEMRLELPELVKKGGAYGVKLRASAPSIHMMRADIQTEVSPMVGNEQQSEELVKSLLGEYEGNTEKLWESNIFGKSLFELVNEGLTTKLKRMPEDARYKIKDALAKIINEGANGLICLLL